jgi:hypothetical protein
VYIYQGFPEFHAFAMLGGALWCTGNMLCGPIVQLIGLGLGLLVWGSTNMIMGWASGTFGLFGLKAESIANPDYNYIGMSLALCGFFIFLNVKSKTVELEKYNKYEDSLRLQDESFRQQQISDIDGGSDLINAMLLGNKPVDLTKDWTTALTATQQRVLGLSMATIAGLLLGCSFDPAQYVNDSLYNGTDNPLNYVFPHFTGIIITSCTYFTIYILINRYFLNRDPFLSKSCIIPGVISGFLWGLAEIAFFIANGALGFSVSFPIITIGPGFIAASWGILVFKEISGAANLSVLAAAFCVTITGLVLVSLSH